MEYFIWAAIVIFVGWLFSVALSALRYSLWGHRGWYLTDLIIFPVWLVFELILMVMVLFTMLTIAEFVYGELKHYRRAA